MADNDETESFETYRDCLSESLLRTFDRKKTKPKGQRSKGRKNSQHKIEQQEHGPEELGDFIEYLAHEIFDALPAEVRTLSYSTVQRDSELAERYSLPLSPDVTENLINLLPSTVFDTVTTYALLPPTQSLNSFLAPSFESFVKAVTDPLPPYQPTSKASECEICGRNWIPLTYHHLIPQSTHEKCLKRGWHEEWELQAVAWLCRACHNFVHKIGSNELLAKDFYTIEKLLEREDTMDWAKWVGRVRWRKT